MKTKTPEFTFTSSQLAAIRLDASRVAVVAGPGSGKSTVLVERIRRLIETGADPRSIFVVTFTNAAARVVEKRLKRLGLNTQLGYAGTLHGLALRLCKAHHHLIPGLPAKISVMNKEQASEFLSDTCIDLQATGTLKAIREAVKNMTILNVIQGAKNVNLIAASYYRRMIRSGLLDFDSILMLAAYICGRLTRDNIVLCQHLLWDEIQDSGFYDHCILSESLAANKFVVGDQDQSAYKFRRATPDLFVKILTRGQWALIKLEDNFRCGPSICQAANKLIAHNKDRMEKQTLAVDREREDAVLYRHYKTEAEETRMLATQIMYNQASMEWSEMAVLVPYNDLAQRYADALQAHGIPVAMRKDAAIPIDWSRTLSLLALISNPDNDFLMYRWLVKTQDVKKADAAKLRALKERCSINHWLPPEESFTDNLELAKVPQYLARFNVQTDSMAIVERVMQELPADASITELCQALADQDLFLTDEGTGVTVTTFHSAKGREWSAVWMPAFEEGFCPRLGASNDLQEERRLAYIGFTRAREYLSVSSAGKRRPIWGREGGKPEEERVASRFVGESGL